MLKLEGIPLSEVLKGIPKPESSQSPVADIGSVPSKNDGPLKSVIRITTRVPTDHNALKQTEVIPSSTDRVPVGNGIPDQTESLPSAAAQIAVDHQILEQSGAPQSLQQQSSQIQTPQAISSTPQLPSSTLPQQPDISTEPPSQIVPPALSTFPGSPFPENKLPTDVATTVNQTTNTNPPIKPRPEITASNQAVPAAIGPIIKVITAPGKKVTAKLSSKEQDRNAEKANVRFESEINNALNTSK